MSKLLRSIKKYGGGVTPRKTKKKTSRNSIPNTSTLNGAPTFSTSGNPLLDLFFIIGGSRGKDITSEFVRAFGHDQTLTLRMLLWARDCRGGAGERQIFRDLFRHLVETSPAMAALMLHKVPELGRWDDVLATTFGTSLESQGFGMYAAALHAQNGLAAKWCPRKGKVAEAFRAHLELSPKRYRKLIVGLSNTVEQLMCARQWSSIDYNKLPSLAASRYSKCFTRMDADRYNKYLEALKKGEAKINASVIFPHDVVVNCEIGNATTADEQWKRLPDYFKGVSKINILPVVDVSGSMTGPPLGNNGSACPMTVSTAIGLYCAERMPGIFKNHYVTFSSVPVLQAVKGKTLSEKIHAMKTTNVGYDTNLQKVFDLILNTAVANKLKSSDLPTHVLVISDMEFNNPNVGAMNKTNYQVIVEKYQKAGYPVPKLVFWNVSVKSSNVPVKAHDENTALISGFSPAIVKSLLENIDEMSPLSVMMRTIQNSRYDF